MRLCAPFCAPPQPPCRSFPLQEASESLAAGKSMAIPKRDQTHPLGPKARAVVQTTIEVRVCARS